MKKIQDLLRKVIATIVAVSVMCAMLWFAYEMLITTPIFEGTLRMVLLACIGVLTLATIYFFVCKIIEIIALLRTPSKAEQKRREIEDKAAEENAVEKQNVSPQQATAKSE